jgi:transcriptional regulator with XRE-family HTH domain
MKKDEFCSLVRVKRKRSGLSLIKYANLIGTSGVTIWRWEHEICMPLDDALKFWLKRINK